MAFSSYVDAIRKLEGRRIVRAEVGDMGDGSGETGPILLLDDGTVIFVLRDAEGNGPGWLEVQPPKLPTPKKGGE